MRLGFMIIAAILLAGCGSTPGSRDSGIRGTALLFPSCPVEPCDPGVDPSFYNGSFVVRKEGIAVARVQTGERGRFEIELDPGRYVVESSESGLPLLKPVDVVVHEGEFTDVTLSFDSGIR
jgi:hypothetical protein